ncbi:MAG: hypothetical protein ABI640_07280 [Gammaproteobacteria bacterium]
MPASKQPTKDLPKTPASQPANSPADGVQGEGDYKSAREFNEAERKFVQSGKVPAAARAAAPKSKQEEQDLIDAEQEGKRHAKK